MLLFQSARSQDKFEKANAWVSQNLVELGGRAVLVVLKDSQVVYNKSFNDMSKRQAAAAKMKARLKDMDEEAFMQDFTPDTRERIASAGQWLMAALAMTFVDQNKFRLSDTVGKFLPILSKNGKGHIKIWHCLTHTTGIKEGGLRETISSLQKTQSTNEYLELISTYPTEGEPGKIFRFGNAGYQILTAIMEKIGEKDLETIFKERIADPLEMQQTDFGKKAFSLVAVSGFSSPNDYVKFLQMILNDGVYKGKRIISKALINEMQKNRVGKDCVMANNPDEAGRWGYGFGVWLMDQPLAIASRKDAIPESPRSQQVCSPSLSGSFPWINYQKKYAAILFVMNSNRDSRFQLYEQLKELVDAAIN
jgi:CubicO group peptidase (beta-lactamase class C family)